MVCMVYAQKIVVYVAIKMHELMNVNNINDFTNLFLFFKIVMNSNLGYWDDC